MRAIFIDPEKQTVENIEIENRDDIIRLIGYDTIIADEIGPDDDHLFFDEECFLRGTKGRFQIDSVIPVAGKGIIAGTKDDGQTITDTASDVDTIKTRLKYL